MISLFQMARGSLPAVLLLLLGFVEAVDIKGENSMISSQTYFSSSSSTVKKVIIHVFFSSLSWCTSPFPRFGFLFLCYQGCLFQSARNSFCKIFPSFAISLFGRFVSTEMHQEDFRGWDFSTEAFSSIFQFFFNSSHVGCSKASGDKILDKQPAPRVPFSRRTLFINPPATDSDTPQFLADLKLFEISNFATFGPMSRTDQIVVTGLNDAWGPNYYFAVKLRQSLWHDIQWGAHENSEIRELRLALWQVLSITELFDWSKTSAGVCVEP